MKLEELLKKRLIIKSASVAQEIEGSLAIAQRFLEKAEGNRKIKYYDVALSLAYQSMFHSARALLFRNNFKERSHGGLIAALKQIYSQNNVLKELLETLDSYRITRHAVQYSGIGCSEVDAEQSIKDAKKFLAAADEIIAGK